jgi:hypothetical protein
MNIRTEFAANQFLASAVKPAKMTTPARKRKPVARPRFTASEVRLFAVLIVVAVVMAMIKVSA